MAREAAGGEDISPWSGGDGDRNCISSGGPVAGEGSGESVTGVTEVGSSGNAAATARWGGNGKDWLATLMAVEGEEAEDSGDEEEEKASSPVWFVAARLGWLLLGFLAGAAMATTVLFLKYDGYPETCIVPT